MGQGARERGIGKREQKAESENRSRENTGNWEQSAPSDVESE